MGGATPGSTIVQCLKPQTEMGDIAPPLAQAIAPGLHLVPSDPALASVCVLCRV